MTLPASFRASRAPTLSTFTSHRVRSTSLVCGFRNPIDAEIRGGRLYVLEYGGNGSVFEITLPGAEPAGGRTCVSVPR